MKVLIADRSKLLIDYAEGLISKYNVSQVVCSDHTKINEAEFLLSNFDLADKSNLFSSESILFSSESIFSLIF